MEQGRESKNAASAAPSGMRRTVSVHLAWLLAPSLLCMPILGMLRYDAWQRENGNTVLRDRIAHIDEQIADIKDFNKVRAQWLTHKQVVDQILPEAIEPFASLSILGRLPPGVQCQFLESRGDRLAMVIRHATPDGDLSTLEQLAKSGFGDLRVSDRQPPEQDGAASLRIEATAPRDASP